jgi:uncharacterized protein (DUF1499 family)
LTVNTKLKVMNTRIAIAGCGLAVVALLMLLCAALGYRTGLLGLQTAFLLLRWGAYSGGAAAVVSLFAVVLTLARPRGERHRLALAGLGLLLGAALIGFPASQLYRARNLPPIHDITTDVNDPPAFQAVLPLRASAPNTVDYGGSEVAAQQRNAYPDIATVTLSVPPAQAFERALATAQAMGWDLVASDSSAGRIEATDTTFWFGFKDDVVVRVRPANGGSRIDVRSLSRVGRGDVGTNARRIRDYLRELAKTAG